MATKKDENKLNEIGTGRLLMFIDGYQFDSCGENHQTAKLHSMVTLLATW